MQFRASVVGHFVSILVDSGSSHSFFNPAIASLLSGHRSLPHPVAVRVANDEVIQCVTEVLDDEWTVQNLSFHSTFRVLPLGSYDVIFGMDWLDAFSTMKIN